MNSNENLECLGLISEKLLPERIKNVIWNKKNDIIVINCGKYYEIHRIGFKHEEIFKREEKCEIKEIVFLDANFDINTENSDNIIKSNDVENSISITVILEDSTIYFVNLSTCEITLQIKIKKNENLNDITAQCFYNTNIKNLNYDNNPFKNELNFNSFSKIDVSVLNFLQNNFDFSNSFIYNSKSNEINFYLKFLINFANMKLNKKFNFVKSINFNNYAYLLLLADETINSNNNNNFQEFNSINLNFHTINFDNFSSKICKTFFHMYFSIQIIDYIANISNIFIKIINKLGIIFFDKYIFSNGLEHELNASNENVYKNGLNEELKKLLYLGTLSEKLKILMKKELLEGKSIIKIDENIYFNLKNIEDIFGENIKPNLNLLTFYFNEIKYNSDKIYENIFTGIEEIFHNVHIKFENFITNISLLKKNYRNFLAWLNSCNNTVNNAETTKNNLNTIIIDYESLKTFIEENSYNMRIVLDILEKDKLEEKENNSKNSTNLVEESYLIKNELILYYLNENKIDLFNNFCKDDEQIQISNLSENNNEFNQKSIKTMLNELKDKINKIHIQMSNKIGSEINMNYFFSILNIPENKSDNNGFTNYKLFSNQNKIFLLIRVENNNIDNLFIVGFPSVTNEKFSTLKLNFKHDNISIIDYDLHKNRELLLLVKSNINISPLEPQSNISNSNIKFSLIASQLDNYLFTTDSLSNKIDFSQTNLDAKENNLIKIDKLIDIDCSDSSFISSGERGLVSVIDNSKNKIWIIDLINNNSS